MEEMPNKNIEVEPLSFSPRLKKKGKNELERKVRVEHKEHLVGIPLTILEKLGLILNAELTDLYVVWCEANPLRSEVKLRFKKKSDIPSLESTKGL